MKKEWKKYIPIAICALAVYLIIHYWDGAVNLIVSILGALSPVFIGIAIAYVINILMSFYEKYYFRKHSDKKFVKGSRRIVCMIAAIITLLLLITLVIWLVVPRLVSCVVFLVSEIPPAVEKLLKSEFLNEHLPKDVLSDLSAINWNDLISKAIQVVATGISSATTAVFSFVGSMMSTVATIFMSVMFSIYMLLSKERLLSQTNRMFDAYIAPGDSLGERKFRGALSMLNENFKKFIIGQCTEAVILGVLCTLGMFIFRFPYAAMIGTLIGFTALIPVAGAYIGAIVGAVMVLTVSPVKALLFIVFIVVLQNLEGNIIYPRVVGNSIGLPAIWVLAAVTVGGGLLGVVGMLIGVPLVATAYQIIRRDVARREEAERKLNAPEEEPAPATEE